jgi:hypothetical protein
VTCEVCTWLAVMGRGGLCKIQPSPQAQCGAHNHQQPQKEEREARCDVKNMCQ